MKSEEIRRQATARTQEVLAALDIARKQARAGVGVSKADLDEALGRGKGYHAHLFSGIMALTAEHVFQILLALGKDPAEFWAEVYGLPTNADARLFAVVDRAVAEALASQTRAAKKSPEPAKKGKSR